MSDVLSSDDLDALAAEYVLGTLDIEERKGAIALLEVDHAFRGTVRIWERRLSELHLMVEPVEPDARSWSGSKPKLGSTFRRRFRSLRTRCAAARCREPGAPAEARPPRAEGDRSQAAEGETGEAKPAEGEAAEPPPEAAGAAPAIVEVVWPEGEPKPPTLVPEEGRPNGRSRRRGRPNRRPGPPSPRRADAGPPVETAGAGEKPGARPRLEDLDPDETLIALALAALIGAWRFFPERLPPQLRADHRAAVAGASPATIASTTSATPAAVRRDQHASRAEGKRPTRIRIGLNNLEVEAETRISERCCRRRPPSPAQGP